MQKKRKRGREIIALYDIPCHPRGAGGEDCAINSVQKKKRERKKKKERKDWMKRVTRFGGGRLKRSNRETRVGIVGNLGIHVRPIWHRNDAPGVENRRGRRLRTELRIHVSTPFTYAPDHVSRRCIVRHASRYSRAINALVQLDERARASFLLND